ncbi:hypothetical protein AKJ57_03880 [candidate division MSBL1 archaeon SCGC-AAA259A05]|uniref:EamA domain-containing protein n=1 Tax=candidate division MSBL1 archaeon SCGC-AAA259A05 TaxID=1698259 RepID=A0A133U987_9EURY|nr:hypothetical protein AKJ57_03880 [candidate division MSBL1 archaeon SCGC-AAA259A05]
MDILAFFLALGAALSWSLCGVINKVALESSDWLALNIVRAASACLLLFPYLIFSVGPSHLSLEMVFLAGVTGVLVLTGGLSLYFLALGKSSLHRISPVASTSRFWAVLTPILFLGEEPTIVVFSSVFLIILGTYLLSPEEGRESQIKWTGLFLALGAGVLWGAPTALNKYCLADGMPPAAFLSFMVAFGVLANGILFSAIRIRRGKAFEMVSLGWGVLSGVLGLFVGQLLWQFSLKMEVASVVSPVVGAKIPFVFIFSVLLLDESPSKRAFFGMSLVFLAVFILSLWG